MKKRVLASFFLSLSLMLSACSGGGSAPAGDSKPRSEGASQTEGKSELIVAVDQEPVGYDPHKVPAASSARVYSLVYDSLTKLDANLDLVPGLAESWETAPDGKSITFHLRKGVKFHNGQEMTAEDVKYTFERILNPDTGSIAKSYFASVDTIEVPDPATVVFKLKTPDAAFLTNASASSASIVPKGSTDLTKEANGTGPFILEKSEPGQYVLLKKNPDYFNKELPKVDAIKFQIMKDEAERMAAIRAGKIDISAVSADSAKLLEGKPGIQIKSYQSLEYSYLGINVKKKPFDDPRVRQAISYAVDRNQIVQTVWKGEASVTGPIAPALTSWALDPSSYPSYTPNVEKAKRLLAEAGYPNGFDTVIETASTYPDMVESAQIIQQHLKAIGINAKINQLEWGNYIDTWKSKDMNMMVGRNTSGVDSDRSMRYFFSTTGSANVWNYSNPKYDELVQKALETVDVQERKKLYDEAQKLLVEDAPNLFLASPKNFYAVRDNVDFSPTAAGESTALVRASVKK
ncbi:MULTISPECIES: ABC transporter substrate-binding protein [Brevibacillus]|uniref:Family 5 extracellular solute-binding protein n=1 Tax=Brevibacillus borstelensis AK1 TaxID=1300222 RepID=M8DHK5_9BACL|nr:ABC transporter substrate-binding protein [Brevibacillus borstelensis]EMT53003.1 family 5 extracellular solute-binding protein [Brevibacillus borstelensis AK1]KKX55589.1 ABC transporter substrate-binding protein [Brevibacillus borstelensis cifa_chp40]MBE5397024.1 ABC transporter substrate-binding protein [Brevibacillus borstelensis]MCC0563362.1 ABC transporter substrate-binding protein [Brevibacillus borstelensis]MCM3471373.1 ABC transporter substrate-binding protein [Brevibacillus borstele